MWLRLLRLVIGLKDSRQFFDQWESKPKPIAPCARDFSRAWSVLQIIARNFDWFIALPAPVVIGRSNCFGFGFRQSFENRSKMTNWILNSRLIHLTSTVQCRRPPYACMKSAGRSNNWLYVYIVSNARQVTLSRCKLLWEYTLGFVRFLVTKLSHSSLEYVACL